jgi:predicted RNA methylase
VRAHRPGDVLNLLFAHILEREVQFVPYLIAHHAAGANAAWLGQRLEAGGDIDPVTEDVAILDDDVAEIDAHAKLDPPFGWDAGVTDRHFALHFDCAAHRIDDAGKFNEESVAGGFDDAAAMFPDLRIAELAADRPQRGERSLVVRAHDRYGRHLQVRSRRPGWWPKQTT